MAQYDFNFVPAKVPDKALDWRTYTQEPYLLDEATARALAERVGQEEVFVSASFQVNVRACRPKEEWPLMFHASIKRRDREVLTDRSAFQQIKNELFGERFEAMELYPSRDRVLDQANQYHLWVPAEEGPWLDVGGLWRIRSRFRWASGSCGCRGCVRRRPVGVRWPSGSMAGVATTARRGPRTGGCSRK